MLFESKDEVKIVKSCPYTKASTGVLEFPPELVAKVAGAVQDSIEWMVLLLGERSADGFHVKVTDFRVPKQRRSGADVKMAEPMEGDGSTVDDAVVGVLHSHHRMGAFFSGTDNTELNPFFKSSIVVAQAKTALGFAYRAEGKVVLPCGSVGKIDFFLKVTDSERWNAVEKHEYDGKAGFGDCDQATVETVETETETITKRVAPKACGLSSEEKTERTFVFGEAGESLLKEIEEQTVSRAPDEKIFGGGGYGYSGGYRPGEYGGGSGSTGLGKLSRRERKRLNRSGKFSATKDGTHLVGSSVMEACEHGVLLTVDCRKCDIEGDGLMARNLDERYVPRDVPPPHESATGVMFNSHDTKCEFDINNDHAGERLYMYIAKNAKWRMWLCEECYDWWMEGASDTFEDDINEAKLEECAHSVKLTESCEECLKDTPPKLITDGARRWEGVAKQVLSAEEFEKAKKEHVQRMLDEVSEKEARAESLKVSERLGIVSGVH